jgi:hypothetical protein
MEFDIIEIDQTQYDQELSIAIHGMSLQYIGEIFSIKEIERYALAMDEKLGLKFKHNSKISKYSFEIIDKNKYLMAKILYGI